MQTSEQIGELADALSKAQSEFPEIHKTNTAKIQHKNGGGSHTYKYADLADILKATTPVLSSNGLAVTQMVDTSENGSMVLRTTIAHKSGQYMQGTMPIGFNGGDPKQLGSMLTYYRRYSFTALVGICADSDDDAAAAGNHEPQRQQPAPASQPPRRAPANEPPPFDDMPAQDSGNVEYTASNGQTRDVPIARAIDMLWKAYNTPVLGNQAFLNLVEKNERWLKARAAKDYTDMCKVEARQVAA